MNSAGGQIVSDDGRRVTLNRSAAMALDTIHALANSPAVDPSLANQMEDQTRLQFEAGRAAFELNYPYVYPSAKADVPDIFKNMAWTVYPTVKPGEPTHVTIGGIDLAVGAFSKHKAAGVRRDPVPALAAERDPERRARRPAARPRVRLQRSQVPEGVPDVEGHLRHAEAGERAAQDARLPERVAADLLHPLAAELREREGPRDAANGRIEDAINSKGLVP